ncbi:MAG: TAXI family TRAP transporter solute-binding subunit [Bilophila wadsworthia]
MTCKHLFKAVALALSLAVGAAPALAKNFTELKAAASPAGGAWYVGMGAMGKAISTMYPEFDVSLPAADRQRHARREGRERLRHRRAQRHSAAAKGIDPAKKPTENVMGLLNLHDSTRMHFIVNKASGITSLAQIKEKKMPIRISMSHTAGNSYLFGKWILEEYGISQQDITAWGGKIYTPSTNDAASMMKDGQLDVALWIGPGEAFIVQDMMNSVDLDILPVDENVIKAVGEKYGLQRDVIPASFYGGKFGKDIVTVSASTELMINKNVSEDIAYKMVKAMCEKRDDIVIASPFWKSFMPEKAGQGLALPLHPGAKYYKEKGWL